MPLSVSDRPCAGGGGTSGWCRCAHCADLGHRRRGGGHRDTLRCVWSGNDSDAQSVPQAVARINSEFASEISRIQTENPTDSVVIHREPDGGSDLTIRNWTDVIAVFAVKTAGADADATDVVTIDEERIDLIRQVFWDMNEVSWYVQTIKHRDDTETILHITITSKKATEMPDFYHFSKSQREALTEVLKPEYAQMLAELVGTYGGEVSLDEAQIRAMLSAMPKDISERRKAVVEKAYSLLGKVNYFWGGKSNAIGWDSRWGTPTRVTAPGSRSTGTVRPYGLDCSGFVDWVFNNSLEYVIGHGGVRSVSTGYCKPISWSEALPGDLVFYPGDPMWDLRRQRRERKPAHHPLRQLTEQCGADRLAGVYAYRQAGLFLKNYKNPGAVLNRYPSRGQ